MALIGEIAVNIVARTGQFTKGLATVRKNLNSTAATLAKFGGATAGALLGAAKLFSSFGDDIAKMAKRTGVAVETLSKLEFAAAQSGASLEAVEKGIRGMARSILDAQRGSAEIVFAFQELGISVAEIAGLSPDQQFMRIALAIADVEDPTKKAALAMKLLGRSGTELIPLFNEGSAGIAALIKEAEDLGIVLSAEDAKAAEELNDAFGRLTFQAKALVKEFAVAVAGPLLEFLSTAKDAGAATIQWVRSNQELVAWVGKIGTVAGIAAAGLKGLSLALAFTTKSVKALTTAIVFLSTHPLTALLTVIGVGAVIAIDKLTGASQKLLSAFNDMTPGANAAVKNLQDVGQAADQTADKVQAAAERLKFGIPLPKTDDIRRLKNELFREEGRLAQRERIEALAPAPQAFLANTQRLRNRIEELQKRIRQQEHQGPTEQEKRLGKLLSQPFKAIQQGAVSLSENIFGGRTGGGLFGQPIFGKIADVFDAITQLPTEFEAVTQTTNDIVQKGSQEAIAFAAQQRQRDNQPEKKIEKNTADTVKAVNGVKSAVNEVAKAIGQQPVFSIPAG